MADTKNIELAYQKAYGEHWKKQYEQYKAERSKDNAKAKANEQSGQVYTPKEDHIDTQYMKEPPVYTAPEQSDQVYTPKVDHIDTQYMKEPPVYTAPEQSDQVYTPKVDHIDTKYMDKPPVYVAPENEQVQEAPVAEQTAPTPEKEEKDQLTTPDDKIKDSYPSLFSMFTEMMGGKQGGDDELSAMFALAFSALLGVEKFKERLEETERELAELRKREQERETAEKAPATVEKAPVVAEQEPKAVDIASSKAKTPADMAYDNIAKGKEHVTLADLQQAGVNLKTDIQPTLRALIKDNPSKLSELAPQGLGNEKAPVNREFATALIARAQQRETIARHNVISR